MADQATGAELAGQVALVTGAASGIGRASALAFAAAGASVALIDIDQCGLEATATEIRDAGADALTIAADVTDLEAIAAAVDRIVAQFGRLDAAHNNAGIAGPYLPLDDYPADEFLRVLQVDLIGVWHCMRAEIAQMRRQRSGAIVNTSSMLGAAAMPNNGPYVAAKHAVNGLTRTAALELGTAGIRVNALAPGVTRTGMTSRRERRAAACRAVESHGRAGRGCGRRRVAVFAASLLRHGRGARRRRRVAVALQQALLTGPDHRFAAGFCA